MVTTKKLLNIRSLRAMTNEMSMEQLEESFLKYKAVYEERNHRHILEIEEEAQKKAKLDQIIAAMEQDGVTIEDVLEFASTQKLPTKRRKYRTPKPRYKWIENGEEKTWTGQGRKPKFFSNLIQNGGDIEDYAIPPNEMDNEQ